MPYSKASKEGMGRGHWAGTHRCWLCPGMCTQSFQMWLVRSQWVTSTPRSSPMGRRGKGGLYIPPRKAEPGTDPATLPHTCVRGLSLCCWLWGEGEEQSSEALPVKAGSSRAGLGIFWVLCTQAFLHFCVLCILLHPLEALLRLSLCFASSKTMPHSMALHPVPFFLSICFLLCNFFLFFPFYFFFSFLS